MEVKKVCLSLLSYLQATVMAEYTNTIIESTYWEWNIVHHSMDSDTLMAIRKPECPLALMSQLYDYKRVISCQFAIYEVIDVSCFKLVHISLMFSPALSLAPFLAVEVPWL